MKENTNITLNVGTDRPEQTVEKKDQNSTEGGVAPAGAKVTGATIRMWLLNKLFHSYPCLVGKVTKIKDKDYMNI